MRLRQVGRHIDSSIARMERSTSRHGPVSTAGSQGDAVKIWSDRQLYPLEERWCLCVSYNNVSCDLVWHAREAGQMSIQYLDKACHGIPIFGPTSLPPYLS
jgi:hypothetical protein